MYSFLHYKFEDILQLYSWIFPYVTRTLLERRHVTVLHALQDHTRCTAESFEDISAQREMGHVWTGYRVSISQSVYGGDPSRTSWDKRIWLQRQWPVK